MADRIKRLGVNFGVIAVVLLINYTTQWRAIPVGSLVPHDSFLFLTGLAGLLAIHWPNMVRLVRLPAPPRNYPNLFIFAIAAPLTEELLFRGLLWYYGLQLFPSKPLWAIITSLLFALTHIPNRNREYHYHWYAAFLPNFFYGLSISAVRDATGGVLFPVLLHSFFNGVCTLADKQTVPK